MRFKGKKIIFSRKDTWSLDCSLSPIIAEGLKKFKEVIQDPDCCAGCPNEFLPNGYENHSCEDQQAAIDNGIEKWHKALDKMIYAFDNKEPEFPDNMMSIDFVDLEPDDEHYHLYKRLERTIHDQDRYDKWHEDREEHYKRVRDGRELFSKFYESLWW